MISKIYPIAGDASYRKFYRFESKNKKKIIVISKKEKYKNLVAYSSVNKFLIKKKILAPRLYNYNIKKGFIEIEDFGNITFLKILLKKKNKFLVYKKLVDLLIKIQKIKVQSDLPSIINKTHKLKKYSTKILHEESDLFFEWYLPFFFNKRKTGQIKKSVRTILIKLYNSLNFSNNCFVHRDFHAENLMKVKKKIGVIDSQDALIGNYAYDLVSLVDDVRISTSKKLREKICKYYLKKTKKILKIEEKIFLRDFNILSIQRNLKILGIFARLLKRDKKPKYIKFIPYTWKLLEERMNSNIFLKLRKILKLNISKQIRNKKIK